MICLGQFKNVYDDDDDDVGLVQVSGLGLQILSLQMHSSVIIEWTHGTERQNSKNDPDAAI